MTNISDQAEANEKYYVALPTTPDQFSEFLKDVLSTKKSMRYRFGGDIEISERLIRHLFSSIDQRLKQNHYRKIQESYVFSFENGESFTENNLEDALVSGSIEAVKTSGFRANIVVLIDFPGEISPQKQEISIVFSNVQSSSKNAFVINGNHGKIERLREADAHVDVQYSNRTWAEDLVNISKKAVEDAPYQLSDGVNNKTSKWVSENFGGLILAISFTSILIYIYYLNKISSNIKIKKLTDLAGSVDVDLFKLLYEIIVESDPVVSASKILAVIVCFFAAAILPILAFSYMFTNVEVGLVFSVFSKDKENIAHLIKAQKRNKLAAIVGFCAAVISSLVASYIYSGLTS